MHATGSPTTTFNEAIHPVLCQRFRVFGMTCGHCERAVAAEVRELTGIVVVRVNATTGTLVIESDHEIDVAAVAEAVDTAGYELVR